MTLIKLYELIRDMANPFRTFNPRNYKVVCNGETVTGIQIDDEKGQVILKTYKRKNKVSKTDTSTAWDPGRPLTVDESHYYYK